MAGKAGSRAAFWLFAALLFMMLLFVSAAWFLNRMLVGATPALRGGTVLHVRLNGAVGESPASGPLAAPLTVSEIDQALRHAAGDDRVVGAVLDVGPLLAGFAKAQEIRAAVHAFRESGKPTIALLEIGSNLELYVAASADTVYQIPTGQLVLGLIVEEMFYRDLLDKLGVEFEVFHTGPFKTAMHGLIHREPTREQTEMADSLLDSVYGQWLADVGADRDLETAELARIFDRGLLTATDAARSGLIDELGYRDEVWADIESRGGSAPRRLTVREYLRATESGLPGLFGIQPVVAVVHVSGTMIPGEFEEGLFAAGLAGGDTIARYVRDARRDRAVRAIVLRVDSPGGAATAADVIAREVRLAGERKPVVVSMSDVAASGGYWVAASGTRILADRATYTGSIGVVMGRLNLSGAYEKLGIHSEVLRRGANADILAASTDLRPEQVAVFEENLQQAYADFIATVADGREMTPEAVESLAAGRVWTGEQALENGLVDQLGGLRQALILARADAGIDAGEQVTIRTYPPRRGLLEQIRLLFGTGLTAGRSDPLGAAFERIRGLQVAIGGGGRTWALTQASLPVPVR